jgi:hypothetical protein
MACNQGSDLLEHANPDESVGLMKFYTLQSNETSLLCRTPPVRNNAFYFALCFSYLLGPSEGVKQKVCLLVRLEKEETS